MSRDDSWGSTSGDRARERAYRDQVMARRQAEYLKQLQRAQGGGSSSKSSGCALTVPSLPRRRPRCRRPSEGVDGMNEIEQAVYDVIYPLRRPLGQSIDTYCRHAARLTAERLASPGRDAADADLRDADRLGKEFDWTAEERDTVLDLIAAARADERRRSQRSTS